MKIPKRNRAGMTKLEMIPVAIAVIVVLLLVLSGILAAFDAVLK